MWFDEKTVKVEKVVLTWDGLTNPEKNDDGSVAHNIGFAIADTAPEKAELDQLVQKALDESTFKGTLPPGANPAMKPADVAKFGALLTGHHTANASTQRGLPPCFDEQGKQITVDQLRGLLYPGVHVSILVHAYAYNNKQRGVKFGIDGVQIVNRAAPKLDVAAGLSADQVGKAFGAAPAATTPPPAATTPPPAAGAATPPPPPAPPANDLASGKIMLPAANGVSYDEYIKAGWTDEQLVANGMMQA